MTAAHAGPKLYSTGVQAPTFGLPRSNASARATQATADALFLAATDFALVWISAAVVLYFRIDTGAINYGTSLAKNAGFLMLLSILVVLFCQVQKLYEIQPRTEVDEAVTVLKAVGLATIVLSASIFLSGQKVVSRAALGGTVLLSATLLVSWRYVRRRRMIKRVATGQDCRNLLIFGWSHPAQLLERHCAEHRLPGYIVKGFLDRRRPAGVANIGSAERRSLNATAIGHRNELCDVVRAHFIDEILVFLPEDRKLVKELIIEARKSGISLRIVPDFYDGLASCAPIE